MNRKQRINAMVLMLCLILFGVFLLLWVELRTLGQLIIMFSGGFALRETLEPMDKEERA